MEKLFDINTSGQSIRCKLYYDKIREIKKVILYGHGFAGHRNTAAAQKFAERILSKYKGIAVLLFDLPCHGDDVKKKLTLQDCISYMQYVISYALEDLHAEALYSYATSFGGYLVLKYIAENDDPFQKIVLRCPAVSMYDVLTGILMTAEDLEAIEKGKKVSIGFDRKIDVDSSFLAELKACDIRQYDYLDHADDILILHGTKDEVVPISSVERFAEDNVIEFIPVENADHRFQNPACMEIATKAALQFFGIAT